jgi:hypothetical protein
MIKVEDLLNLNLTKINSAPLKKAIEDWISDYNKETDKELFAKESKENINKLYAMVEQYAPEAIQKTKKKPEPKETKPGKNGQTENKRGKGKLMKILILVIGNFKGVLKKLKQADLDEADFFVLLEMTKKLEKALESGDDKKIKKAVEAQLDAFDKWQEKMKKSDNKTHKEQAKNATESINQLLDELGIPTLESNGAVKSKEKSKSSPSTPSQTALLTKELVRVVIDELTDIEIDLEGQDETIIAATRLELEEALEDEEQSKFRKKVVKEAQSFKDWAMDISDAKTRKQSVTAMNKLFNALGESLLNPDGKEKKESEKTRSKRILEELDELQPELERCRAVVSEANRKKREAQGSKPKKTRLTQLKNKLLSIAGLIPPQLKDNPDVQKKTEKILLTAHRELVNAWGMNKVKAKPGAEAIREKFDAMEDKSEKTEKPKAPTHKKKAIESVKDKAARWKQKVEDYHQKGLKDFKDDDSMLCMYDKDLRDHLKLIEIYKKDPSLVYEHLFNLDTGARELIPTDIFKEIEKAILPTEKEIIKHLSTLSNSRLANDAAYILSGDLDRIEARIEDSKEYRIETEKELAKTIVASEHIKTYLKEIGFKN